MRIELEQSIEELVSMRKASGLLVSLALLSIHKVMVRL